MDKHYIETKDNIEPAYWLDNSDIQRIEWLLVTDSERIVGRVVSCSAVYTAIPSFQEFITLGAAKNSAESFYAG